MRSLIIAVTALLIFVQVAPAAPVDDSIEKGKAFLYSLQNPQGNWEQVQAPIPAKMTDGGSTQGPQWSGRTALIVYALLKSGERSGDARMEKAIKWLKESNSPSGTYALALRCLVWESLGKSEETKKLAKRDCAKLLASVTANGLHTYYQGMKIPVDLSNSQIAALGIWAAGESGVEIPSRYWKAAAQGWRTRQLPDGSWAYGPDQPDNLKHVSHPGITAAGVATLYLAHEALDGLDDSGTESDPSIDRGCAWLTQHFNELFGFMFFEDRSLYVLYGVERAAVAGGIKRFGDQIWYERAIAFLMSRQQPNGKWELGVTGGGYPEIDTAFALMTMSFAKAPVAITKLDYGSNTHWNQRSRDVARVTRWVGEQSESLYRWQVAKLDGPAVDLIDGPLLYVTGDQALSWNEQNKKVLVASIDTGALAVFNANNGSKAFADSVTKLGEELYPNAKWRILPENHPIFAAEQFNSRRWKRQPVLMGLTNGIRELMILVPQADFSRGWQVGAASASPELNEIAADLVQYAGGPGSLVEPARPKASAMQKAVVQRLAMPGEEARAWPAASAWLSGSGFDLDVQTVTLSPNSLLAGTKLVHVPVSQTFKPTPEQIAELVRYANAGGTVLFETVAGNAEAAVTIDSIVADSFPKYDAADLAQLTTDSKEPFKPLLRRFANQSHRGATVITIRKMNGGGRIGICKLDLSSGLAGLRTDGIDGLAVESSRDLIGSLLR